MTVVHGVASSNPEEWSPSASPNRLTRADKEVINKMFSVDDYFERPIIFPNEDNVAKTIRESSTFCSRTLMLKWV